MAAKFQIRLKSGKLLGPVPLAKLQKLAKKGVLRGDEQVRENSESPWRAVKEVQEIFSLVPTPAGKGFQALPGAEAGWFSRRKKKKAKEPSPADSEKTEMFDVPVASPAAVPPINTKNDADYEATIISQLPALIDEATVVVHRPASRTEDGTLSPTHVQAVPGKKGGSLRALLGDRPVRTIAIGLAVTVIALDTLFPDSEEKLERAPILNLQLPEPGPEGEDPNGSQRAFAEGIKNYVQDTASGYARASKHFLQALQRQSSNVRAIALLISSYINAIDSTPKDERTFAVLNKLLEIMRASKIEIPETVIAEVEYAILSDALDSARQRIVDYTRTHKYELELYYYYALVLHLQGDHQGAARFLNEIPDDRVFSAKVFYLRGEIAQAIGTKEEAVLQYQKALARQKQHPKSLLRLIEASYNEGKFRETEPKLETLLSHLENLSPVEIADAMYYMSKIKLLQKQYKDAEKLLTRATQLNPNRPEYTLELYAIKAGGSSPEKLRGSAKMYFYLGAGERLAAEGKLRDALREFLLARESNSENALPLKRIGDIFFALEEYANAQLNYEKAVRLAPRDLGINSRLVRTLIQNFEFETALKQIDSMARIPKSSSTVARMRGELAVRQERYLEALAQFKMSLMKDYVDPQVYTQYALALERLRQFKDAAFFYSLARRVNKTNFAAIIGQARCVAQLESIDRGLQFLQDAISKLGGSPPELLLGLSELHLTRGDISVAQKWVDQVVRAHPERPDAWGAQAKVDLALEDRNPKALDSAIKSLGKQIELAPGNADARMERFKLFVRKTDYGRALEELNEITRIYKRFPNLHYNRGNLYALMGNLTAAIDEYQTELKNHPDHVNAMMALGQQFMAQKNLDAALSEFSKAMKLAPKSGEPRHMAGYVYYLKKNYEAAVALLQAAVQLDSGNPMIYKRLGAAYRSAGDGQKAAEAFRKYLDLYPDAPDRVEFERFL